MKVVQIDYGAGNVKSIQFAFERLGISPILSRKPEDILSADKVLFPGVGEASSAMTKLNKSGLEKLIPNLRQPVLGICLGMQLMCERSEENDTKGLGIFPLTVHRFSKNVKVPQIGWNTIYDLKSPLFNDISEEDFMYMVHSYYVPLSEETIATSNYDIQYSAALKKDNFYGVQFHPEKSSIAGEQLLQNFLTI